MNVFLDDIRFPIEAYRYIGNNTYKEEWKIVRNYEEFTSLCKKYWNEIDIISFDHDLGEDEAKNLVAGGISKRKARAQKKLAKSGMDCAKWLINYALDNKLSIPLIWCHSQNPVGKENILELFQSYKKHKL